MFLASALAFVALVILLGSATGSPAQRGSLVRATVHSRALEGNLLNDSTHRSVIVYLPPSYRTAPHRRYPVVVLLHGVGDSNEEWLNGQHQGLDLSVALDSLIASRAIQEVIVVLPDARNAYDGSFYTNSAVGGNWEDFVTKDVVRYVDTEYRVLPHPDGWGIAGHSMGGYGALKLAMKHADLFSAVYALSPCCIEWAGDLSGQNPFWERTLRASTIERQDEIDFYPKFFIALAVAWSPNPARPPFHVDLPFAQVDSHFQPSEPAYSEWSANMILPLAGQFRTDLSRLRGIRITYGTREQFAHIPLGAVDLSKFLTVNGIHHDIQSFEGDHFDHIRSQLVTDTFPFFSHSLAHSRVQ
jgi:S-formylglutathione hydrolase FrmB